LHGGAIGDNGEKEACRAEDGSVEAVFEGAEDAVANMITSCRNGPPSGRVDDVAEETTHADELGLRRAGEAFSVLPTI